MTVQRSMVVGVAVLAAVPAIAVAGSAAAPAPATTHSGCVVAGTILDVKRGENPTGACPASGRRIVIGPGDVTGVTAGTGLTGGGSAGDVTLAVDSAALQRRVTGTCQAGSAITAVAEDGTVTCSSGPRYFRGSPAAEFAVAAGKSTTVTLPCTEGRTEIPQGRVVSGGISAEQQGFAPGVLTLNESYPRSDNAWSLRITNNTDSSQPFHPWVVCIVP